MMHSEAGSTDQGVHDDPWSHRARLLGALRGQSVDRLPDLEFGAWAQTIERWAGEGMDVSQLRGCGAPQDYLEHYFRTDESEYGPALDIRVGIYPPIEEEVLETRGDYQIVRDKDGAIIERLDPQLGASIPRHLRYVIENRGDWEKLRDERLDAEAPGRIAAPVDALARRFCATNYPVVINVGSLYGYLRNWMGVERLSLLLYDDRPFVEEMMEHLTHVTLRVLERLGGFGLQIDRADWWEDMCYRTGPLLSPRMFREMLVPRYRRITNYLREEFGVGFNQVDCDGNIHALVPLWAGCGINVMFPIESLHTDPYRAAEQVGPRGLLRGGFNKMAIIEGPAAIDAEFARLAPLVRSGRLIPHTDHRVPPDVSYANYLHYRRRKCEMLGKPWREPGVATRTDCIREWRATPPVVLCTDAPSGYIAVDLPLAGEQRFVVVSCTIESPDERPGWLDLGSDGPIRARLNGMRVWSSEFYRDAAAGQDQIPIQLRRGCNDLVLEVGPGRCAWGFQCSLRDPCGQPWRDIAIMV